MILLVEGHGRGYNEDGYMFAYEEAELNLEYDYPDLKEWLDENTIGKYSFVDEYDQDYMDVTCYLYLDFELEIDAMAFKLVWGMG